MRSRSDSGGTEPGYPVRGDSAGETRIACGDEQGTATMTNPAWEISHSVETDANPDFAWSYWTNVANWDDPPAEFELNGPFAAGSYGTTKLPGQEPLRWLLREVTAPNAATIEMQLNGATLSFEWRFDGLSDGRTRLTQRVVLRGDKASAYASQVESTFKANLPDGMNKIARAMAQAAANRKGAG
jgi:hypothetical protein